MRTTNSSRPNTPAVALEALRAEQSPPLASQQSCRSCGPRPEADAIFCSTCGVHLSVGSSAEPAEHSGETAPGLYPAARQSTAGQLIPR